jgi:hypothetical protein
MTPTTSHPMALSRIGKDAEIASFGADLAGPEASFITGLGPDD